MVNVVCNAVCTDDGTYNPAAATYLKNSIVSLTSAVGNELEKILFTNIRDIPEEFQKIMSRHNIKIMFCPFDYFRYQENIPWKLAFYKLNAIKWACEKLHFEKLMLLDTDTVCIKPLDVVFNECRSLMLYYVGLSSQCTDHKVYIDEWKRFFDEDFVGNYWGGEFICGSKICLTDFINDCFQLFLKMEFEKKYTQRGDEFYITTFAEKYNHQIGNPFIERLWTTKNYYLVSTAYKYGEIAILHIPNEKDFGLIKLYEHIKKKGCLPHIRQIAYICGLPNVYRKFSIEFYVLRLKHKLMRR